MSRRTTECQEVGWNWCFFGIVTLLVGQFRQLPQQSLLLASDSALVRHFNVDTAKKVDLGRDDAP
jgi:hypothetical protein